jgi:hypothetical protein
VYGIASTGYDGKPATKNVPPHERTFTKRFAVPGNSIACTDAYGIAQALAWVAARLTDVAQRLQWRSEIQRLMNELVGAGTA